jgi:hypothetical protein
MNAVKRIRRLIAVLAASILAAGFCALVITGCGKHFTAKDEVSLEEMNRALGVMSMSRASASRTVEELTNFPAFKGRPFAAPPAGKKYAIDLGTHQISVVAQ